MKILILGGTNFVGRNLVDLLLQDPRFELTLYNRGVSNSDLFPSVEKLKGNRNIPDDHQVFNGRQWDCTIDISCYFPHQMQHAVDFLGESAGRYILVSTNSVYSDLLRDDDSVTFENDPTLLCSSEQAVCEESKSYGSRKAECERLAIKNFSQPLVLRPAMIVGRHDPTDRLYYWLYRLKQERSILIPEAEASVLPLTCVQDFCLAIKHFIETKPRHVIYNANTFSDVTIMSLLETASSQLGSPLFTTRVDGGFLEDQGLTPWFDIPLWIGQKSARVDSTRLESELCTARPTLSDSLGMCIEYYEQLRWPEPSYGLSLAREARLLESHLKNYS